MSRRKIMGEFRVMSPLRYAVVVLGAIALNAAVWSGIHAQINNPGAQISGAVVFNNCVKFGPGVGQIQDAGGVCGSIAPKALTETDDTNVTMVLTGAPATALLQPVSMALGWTGTLAAARLNSNVVQSVVNDTNVTGTIAGQALTFGWSGTLGLGRGGLGASQSAATANQVPVYPGSGGGAVPTSIASIFDTVYCNTVGNIIVRLTGAWTCSTGIPVNVTWFGVSANTSAVYNGTKASANATPLTNALAIGQCVFFPANSNGYSIPGATYTISSGTCIDNPSMVTLYSQPSLNSWTFHLAGTNYLNTNDFILNNINVDMTGAAGGTTAFRYATASVVAGGGRISNLTCSGANECLGMETGSGYILNMLASNINSQSPIGRSFYLFNVQGFVSFDGIGCANTTFPTTFECGRFEGMIGLELSRYTSTGPSAGAWSSSLSYSLGARVITAGHMYQSTIANNLNNNPTGGTGWTDLGAYTYQSGQIGLVVNGTTVGKSTVYLRRVLIDNTQGDCMLLNNVDLINSVDTTCYQNLGNQMTVSTATKGLLVNTRLTGATGVTGAPGGANGLTCSPCTNMSFVNTQSIANTGQDYVLTNSTGNTFAGGTATDAGGGGILESGTSNQNIFTNFIFANNTGANITLTGANSNVCDYVASGSMQGCFQAMPYPGVVSGSVAASGMIGQIIESNIASGSAVSLVNNAPKDITTITLTPGDYEVSANCQFTGAIGATVTYEICSISGTANTLDGTNGRQASLPFPAAFAPFATSGVGVGFAIAPVAFNVTSNTTLHLVQQSGFTSTSSGFGLLHSRRVH